MANIPVERAVVIYGDAGTAVLFGIKSDTIDINGIRMKTLRLQPDAYVRNKYKISRADFDEDLTIDKVYPEHLVCVLSEDVDNRIWFIRCGFNGETDETPIMRQDKSYLDTIYHQQKEIKTLHWTIAHLEKKLQESEAKEETRDKKLVERLKHFQKVFGRTTIADIPEEALND